MKIDKKTIEDTAELAKLHLDNDEKDDLLKEMSDIINYVEKIGELDTSSVEPTDNIAHLKNVFREDTVESSINKEDIEKISPNFENGYFIVPKIIEGSH